jgi:hypothetical protein
MSDNKEDDKSFWVENPDWTYGRKLVVLKSDYDKLCAELATLRARLEQQQTKAEEWEKAARLARQQRGLVRVVK